jgi:uncharacterized protein YaeQ
MAQGPTIYSLEIVLSDVDREVYQALSLRIAKHPSESMRYMLTRTFAYCLSYEDGIAFSKGGISDTDEPPVAVTDPTGLRLAWIDVGAPSAERLHKAAKAAPRLQLYSHASLASLQREASTRAIHKVADIEVWLLDPTFLDELEKKIDRRTKLEIARTDGRIYVTVGEAVLETELVRASLVPAQ